MPKKKVVSKRSGASRRLFTGKDVSPGGRTVYYYEGRKVVRSVYEARLREEERRKSGALLKTQPIRVRQYKKGKRVADKREPGFTTSFAGVRRSGWSALGAQIIARANRYRKVMKFRLLYRARQTVRPRTLESMNASPKRFAGMGRRTLSTYTTFYSADAVRDAIGAASADPNVTLMTFVLTEYRGRTYEA